MQDVSDATCTLKFELGFIKTCSKIGLVYNSFRIFLIISINFSFQGSHIGADLAILKYMTTLKLKSDPIFLFRKLKNL